MKTQSYTGAAGAPPRLTDEPSERVVDRSIGDLLREVREIDDSQVDQILRFSRDHRVRFGEAAISLKLASSGDVLWALSQQFHYPCATEDDAVALSEELVMARDPFSDQAETFRDIRSQLIMGVLSPDQPRRALAVLSPNVGDGKTYFAANLAVAFSQLGARTLLVDADMRTPRQHDIFNVAGRAGLSNILAGRAESDVIHQSRALPSLYVLPVGTLPPNPLELVQRSAFGLLMRELLGKFDHIVVDTPAACHGADARVLASKCGAGMVIGRRHTTRMDAMQSLIAQVSKSEAKLAGVLINEH
jgi:receptor protein-tyrosine kinase